MVGVPWFQTMVPVQLRQITDEEIDLTSVFENFVFNFII